MLSIRNIEPPSFASTIKSVFATSRPQILSIHLDKTVGCLITTQGSAHSFTGSLTGPLVWRHYIVPLNFNTVCSIWLKNTSICTIIITIIIIIDKWTLVRGCIFFFGQWLQLSPLPHSVASGLVLNASLSVCCAMLPPRDWSRTCLLFVVHLYKKMLNFQC